MAFDVKELMIDLTNTSAMQPCHPSKLPCAYTCYPTILCHPSVFVGCKLGTYTCFAGSIVTCGGTIYCAGTEDPTLLFKDIDSEVLAEMKAQLNSALKEVEQRERQLGETAKKPAKEKKK